MADFIIEGEDNNPKPTEPTKSTKSTKSKRKSSSSPSIESAVNEFAKGNKEVADAVKLNITKAYTEISEEVRKLNETLEEIIYSVNPDATPSSIRKFFQQTEKVSTKGGDIDLLAKFNFNEMLNYAQQEFPELISGETSEEKEKAFVDLLAKNPQRNVSSTDTDVIERAYELSKPALSKKKKKSNKSASTDPVDSYVNFEASKQVEDALTSKIDQTVTEFPNVTIPEETDKEWDNLWDNFNRYQKKQREQHSKYFKDTLEKLNEPVEPVSEMVQSDSRESAQKARWKVDDSVQLGPREVEDVLTSKIDQNSTEAEELRELQETINEVKNENINSAGFNVSDLSSNVANEEFTASLSESSDALLDHAEVLEDIVDKITTLSESDAFNPEFPPGSGGGGNGGGGNGGDGDGFEEEDNEGGRRRRRRLREDNRTDLERLLESFISRFSNQTATGVQIREVLIGFNEIKDAIGNFVNFGIETAERSIGAPKSVSSVGTVAAPLQLGAEVTGATFGTIGSAIGRSAGPAIAAGLSSLLGTAVAPGVGTIIGAVGGGVIGGAVGDAMTESLNDAVLFLESIDENVDRLAVSLKPFSAEIISASIEDTMAMLEAKMDQAEVLGPILAENIKAKTEFSLAISQLGASLATIVTPMLTEITKFATTIINSINNAVPMIIRGIGDMLTIAVDAVLFFLGGFVGIGPLISMAVKNIIDAINALKNPNRSASATAAIEAFLNPSIGPVYP